MLCPVSSYLCFETNIRYFILLGNRVTDATMGVLFYSYISERGKTDIICLLGTILRVLSYFTPERDGH